jgi:uncharacterized secreted protein with C-terminal beta-propeller domain
VNSSRRLAAASAVVAVTLSGCSAAGHLAGHRTPGVHEPRPPGSTPTPRPSRDNRARPVPALATFADCGQLLDTLRSHALAQVGPYGLDGGVAYATDGVVSGAGTAGGGSAAAGSAGGTSAVATAPEAAPAFSGTNNQVAGVDEPDTAKTNGHVLALVRNNPLGVDFVDVSGAKPARMSSLLLSSIGSAQLLLAGPLVVAIGPAIDTSANSSDTQATRAVVVDISDPRHPKIVRTFRVPGYEVDARYVAGRVVLVVQASPALVFPPLRPGVPASVAKAANQRVVRRAPLSEWIAPVTTAPAHHVFQPSCTSTWHSVATQPNERPDDALGTVGVVSFDPANEDSVRQTTVVGSGNTVYASTDALYLAATSTGGFAGAPIPVDAGPIGAGPIGAGPIGAGGVGVGAPGGIVAKLRPQTTQIHEFDLSDPANPHYAGSGTVPGTLLDQYSMGDYDGYLRVATTVGTAIPAPGEGNAPQVLSDNRVTVLHAAHGALVQVGQLRGLGRGERIYGVRFLDRTGYVVTFRQIDPLFVLDLSDPRHPRSLGHLKVTGYSAYLHPLGNGLLFGLGREVNSRAAPIGEQLSVFDVSDPAHPTLRSRLFDRGASSPAEEDHHAFLWWAKDRLVVVPMSRYDGSGTFANAVYHVDSAGRLRHVGDVTPPRTGNGEFYYGNGRTIVIGGLLYTVTDQGVLANDLHSLARVAWLPFA